jgi:hypothetical protein
MGRAIKRFTPLGVLLGSVVGALALAAAGQESDKDVPAKATVGGNYSELLRKIEVPRDKQAYGDFFEGGHFPALPEYAGHHDLPAGHWVYVAPHWYIWKESKKPRDLAAAAGEFLARNDPFAAMANKDVSLRVLSNQTIKGRIAETRGGYVLVTSPESKTRYWVNKSHVSYIQWEDDGEVK